MDSSGRRTKRDVANERLRAGFLLQAGPRLAELHALLREDPSAAAQAAVAHELSQLAQTARSLKLSTLASVAQTAATNLVGDGRTLRPVARAIRQAHPDPLLGNLVIVAADAQAERLAAQAQAVSEPVTVVPSTHAWFEGLVVRDPTALVVPVAELATVGRLAEDPLPLIAYGAPWDPENPAGFGQRIAAAEFGALATLPERFELPTLLELARWLQIRHEGRLPVPGAQPGPGAPRIVLLMDEGRLRDAWEGALRRAGAEPLASSSPRDLGATIEWVAPQAIVLGASIDGVAGFRLVAALRGHPRGRGLVIAGLASPSDAEALLRSGADDRYDPGEPPEVAALHLLHRIRRHLDRPTDQDPITGLPNRRAWLRALDAHLAGADRTQAPFTVALLQLDGLERAASRHGEPAVHHAARALATLLRARVRALDLVGRLDHSTFALCLLRSTSAQVAPRIQALRSQFLSECRADPLLRSLGLSWGIADSEIRTARLMPRAVEALLRSPG